MIGLSLFIAVASAAAGQDRPIWLAVGRPGLIEAIQPLAQYRRDEGLETIISTQPIETALAACPRRPRFLLLVGDNQPDGRQQPWYLPTQRRALYRWRESQTKEFAADMLWGDTDHDLSPEIAVGRIPARSRDDVERVVAKLLAFERRKPTPADLRLVIWGGSPAYGPAIDQVATAALLGGVRATAPRWIEPWIISADPNHVLCGWPPDQPQEFADSLAAGGVLGVLMGHADVDYFFSMRQGERSIALTNANAKRLFDDAPPAPPVVLFACNAGAFDAARPCLAETMLLARGGPVATIAATTESHPLTNYYSGLAQLAALDGRQDRLGLMWLELQRRASHERNLLIEGLLRNVEGKLEDEINIPYLHRDQMLMYTVFGDPATHIRLPQTMKATIERTPTGWTWTATRPPNVEKLWIGFRSADMRISNPDARPRSDAEAARSAFEAANQEFEYAETTTRRVDEPWHGEVSRPGWLRLVATGPGQIYATVLVAE